ncbi:MAG: hypothetical protein ABIP95_12560 [Pelobium sp.]
MKLNSSSILKKVLAAVVLLSCLQFNAFAQKAEEVQSNNLWAKDTKVDGKLNEWGETLKANNKSTNLSYTIANDGKNIYLAISTKDLTTKAKIIAGGITLTINPDGKKKSKEGFSLTYPVINRRQGFQGTRPAGGGGQRINFQDMTQVQRDSMAIAQGRAQLAAAKDIKVFGFSGITDSLISIYNEYGIKTVAKLDDAGIFNYELAIPLALMNLTVDNAQEFSYNIKLNGLQINFGGGDGGNRGGGNGGGGNVIRVQGGGGNFGGGRPGNNIDFQSLMTPTDLWGKYTLAKK